MPGPEVEQRLCAFFAADPRGALAVYLFGSYARGTARPESDVDVAVLYGEPPPSTLDAPQFALEGDLETALGKVVQVIVLDTAPIDLIHRVLTDGKLVFERDRSARIRFEVRARAEYLDFEPVLRRYRKQEPRPS